MTTQNTVYYTFVSSITTCCTVRPPGLIPQHNYYLSCAYYEGTPNLVDQPAFWSVIQHVCTPAIQVPIGPVQSCPLCITAYLHHKDWTK